MSNGSYGEWKIARWSGAVFYWILSGGRKKMSELLIEKYDMKNAWTGYLLYLILLGSFIYLIISVNA